MTLAASPACGGGGPAGLGLLPPFDDARDASVDIEVDGCGPRIGLGSGSMIDDRLALTAAHVVAGAEEIVVRDTDGEATEADVVLFDPDLDVAVLRTDEPLGEPIAIRTEEARVGENGVVALPDRDADRLDVDLVRVRVLRTVNIRTTDIYLDDPVERAGFEVEAPVDPGDSGALVVLPGGGAGVVWARSNQREARAWAVDLPRELADPDGRRELADPDRPVADVGPCIRSVGSSD